ncbi:MAG: metal ABC transporter substrate-binding protein, partial [Candidatus Limnocylindrales bacterium]
LGYFAERYGFELIGTVIPGLTTSGEPTAREMAELIADIEADDVPVVFAEVGTPQAVAEAVASDSGATLVPLSTSQLPDGGTYQDLIRDIATTVATALAPEGR